MKCSGHRSWWDAIRTARCTSAPALTVRLVCPDAVVLVAAEVVVLGRDRCLARVRVPGARRRLTRWVVRRVADSGFESQLETRSKRWCEMMHHTEWRRWNAK